MERDIKPLIRAKKSVNVQSDNNVHKIYENNKSFKKIIFTVFNNPEFGCELAYMAAKLSNFKVVVIDLDTMNATVDIFLSVTKEIKDIQSFNMAFDNTGLNVCLDAADKSFLTEQFLLQACIQKRKNLYVLTGNYNFANFEYYNKNSLETLIDKAYSAFDITILITNKFLYDQFTLTALKRSDYNLYPIRADRPYIREINNYVSVLEDKQDITIVKSRYISFEYKPSYELPHGILEYLTDNKYIGSISYTDRRVSCRNKRKAYYSNHMDKIVQNEYRQILSQFAICTKLSSWRIFADRFIYKIRKKKKQERLVNEVAFSEFDKL